jgi:precorrin-2 dehydrogenase / sirohydrochlorin ferrochelatase
MKPVQLFPAFLKIEDRPCLVVGAGTVGEEKIHGLLRAGANVRVVAPQGTMRVQEWARAGMIRWDRRRFRPADLSGAFLVIAATSSPELHERIYKQARRRSVLCNVVDDPEHCDFYYGSVLRRGALQIAISSGGQSPALAQRLRKELEIQFGGEYEGWVRELGEARERLFSRPVDPKRRKELLHRLASEVSLEEYRRRQKGRPRAGVSK